MDSTSMSLEHDINDFLDRRITNHADILDYKSAKTKTNEKSEFADHDPMQANGKVTQFIHSLYILNNML